MIFQRLCVLFCLFFCLLEGEMGERVMCCGKSGHFGEGGGEFT